MKVSVVIVSWNVKTFLVDCIESIIKYPSLFDDEIIVVDNASTDGTVEAVIERFPEVRLIANTDNTGFAQANNQGAAVARGEYLFIVNPDTLLLPNTLNELVKFMDCNPDIAICGPHVLNEDRTTQRSVRGLPTWGMAFSRHTPLGTLGLFRKSLRTWRCRDFNYHQQADVEQLIGAALLVRRNIFERVCGFDERFFMYYEEVDLCKRIKEEGGRIVYNPSAELIHLGGQSSKQIQARKRFMMLNSLVLYLQKHTPGFQSRVLSGLFKAGVLLQYLFEWIGYYAGYRFSIMLNKNKRTSKCAVRYKAAHEFLSVYYLKFLRGNG